MPQNIEPLENLVDQFARFPGICRKGATRMAYEVMAMSNEQAMELAVAMRDNHEPVVMAEDYADTNVSVKVVKLIQSYTKIVNETVWLKR